jgi:hypothetical protein
MLAMEGDAFVTLSFPTFIENFFTEFRGMRKGPEKGVVVHICNPSTQEAEAGGSSVPGQPGTHRETLSQKIF